MRAHFLSLSELPTTRTFHSTFQLRFLLTLRHFCRSEVRVLCLISGSCKNQGWTTTHVPLPMQHFAT
ncbi:hypothetical protein GOP47_0005382 [Adiantum capillus-veneris]|uniref:Uncharacterized protein n=1 Tax=Adiantum capillus-veneris TaxID=13818 RepID=A0A9D4V589_ADICA|nr:hypothetical protein GOP47_0005382 [Adiantum capillus-veneris]